MLFLIFTAEGLSEAQADILSHKADLWLNPGLKQQSDLSLFEQAGVNIHYLPDEVDANSEKAVLAALTHVEKHTSDPAIFVEYL